MIPIIHITDLHHPPHDVDDLFDLVTLYGMPEADVRAVLLDYLGDVGEDPAMYEPGFIPVTQLNWLTAKAVPAAVGPGSRLMSPNDAGERYPVQEQSAIELFLKVLRESKKPVRVTSVGSCRIIACALNRDFDLCKKMIDSLYIVAGCAHYDNFDSDPDYNVKVDPHAYVRVMSSGIPISWYPCCSSNSEEQEIREKYKKNSCMWLYPQRRLTKGIDSRLHAWIVNSLAGNLRGDILRALKEQWYGGTWWACMKQTTRQFWSTAALVHAAGRRLVRTEHGWRFLPADQVSQDYEEEKLNLIPVDLDVFPGGHTKWSESRESRIRLYERNPGERHNEAMGEAMNTLLRELLPYDPEYRQEDKSPN